MTIRFSIGLITDEEQIPLKEVEVSPDDRMETILLDNLGQFHVDFVVLCGDTEIWNAKEYGGASFDFSPYSGQELMVYNSECEKYKVLKVLRKAYKNATDTLAQFFVKTPMPHIQLNIEGTLVTALVDTGVDVLTAYNANVDFKRKCVRFNDEVEAELIKMD